MPTVTDRVTDLFTLNRAERRLVSAAEQDTVADLRVHEDGDRPVIRAELLRELCTGGRQWNVKDRIRMIGGQVEGRLDLSGAYLAHTLEFTDCVFEEIDLRKAQAKQSLAWIGEQDARIGALIADDFESDADLTVAGVTVTGVISLHWANVRGDLRLTNSHLVPPGGQGLALGAQAGERRIREVVTDAGFRRFRRVAETPINLVYEARP